MTERVVDPLQLVEIKKQHGERRALRPAHLDHLAEVFVKMHPVGQPGQRVVDGEEADAVLCGAGFAEITHHNHALPLASPVHVAHDVFDRDTVAIAMQREALIRQLGARAHDLAHAGVLGGWHKVDRASAGHLIAVVAEQA